MSEHFLRASEWLASVSAQPALVVVGAPFAGASISKARCDLAPAAIREALERFSVYSSEELVTVERLAVRDGGDLSFASDDVGVAVDTIASAVSDAGAVVALFGGDNSVTAGGVRGSNASALVTFDAHHDCRPFDAGRTNGSVVRELIEGGALRGNRVSQIGIHGFSNAEPHARYARDAGIAVTSPRMVRERGIDVVVGETLSRLEGARMWVDFDIDCLDRAFAPGTAASMPGGLMPGDLERAAFLFGRHSDVVGMDITELDPSTDVASATVRAACSVFMAFAAGVAFRMGVGR